VEPTELPLLEDAVAVLGERVSYEDLPYFFSDQYDLGMEFFGHAEGASDVQVEAGESDELRERVATGG
jgi:3-phenylpropionate/trans-cinnamate dioxygenase ferredoxin reductase subunit